jgi:hypothetical protein
MMAKMGVEMRAGMKTQMAEIKTEQESLVAGLEAYLQKIELYPVRVDWLQFHMQHYVLYSVLSFKLLKLIHFSEHSVACETNRH